MNTGLTVTASGDLLKISEPQAEREIEAWFEINQEQE